MPDPADCPTEQQWADFLAGQLPPSESASVRVHLDACSRCTQLVDRLRAGCRSTDTDLPPAPAVETPLLPGMDEAAEIDDYSSREEKFDASVLQPSDNPQALGRLGKYEVLAVLGCGGMGVVLRGTDTQLCRPVAVKLLNRQLASKATARRRFLREARAAAAINHPNVVTIYAVEEYRDTPVIVMELVVGSTLRECIHRARRLDPMEVLRISSQVAAGLAAAHAQGVIHRDVKPGNILLEDKVGRVKLTDFGVARAALDNVDITTHGVVVGTPAYMAPEQVRGEKIDARADLFALGCVMYAMFTARSPFHDPGRNRRHGGGAARRTGVRYLALLGPGLG
jgi:serine/threonine-protein kinase